MAKKPQIKVEFTERMLALARNSDQKFAHVLVWFEKRDNRTVALHTLRNQDGRIEHKRTSADNLQYLEATNVISTAAEFEGYLRKKLVAYGGNPGAYEHLGVGRPSVEAVVSVEKKAEHDELYARTARVLKVPEKELREKYGHLNPGLQAMSLRNKLRKAGRSV